MYDVSSVMKSLIRSAVFLFLVLVATVPHGGGAVYVFLLLLGLMLGWPAWHVLDAQEKRVIIGFMLFFVLISLSLVNTEDISEGMRRVEKYAHFLLFAPMYMLLRRYQNETGKYFLYGMLISSVVMLGQGYYQATMTGLTRATGAYHHLIFGDISMLVVVVVACGLLTVAKNWRHYLLGAFAISMALSTSVLSGARGAWILIPIAALWFLWIKRKSLGALSLILFLLLGPLLIIGGLNIDRVKSKVNVAITEVQEYSQNKFTNSSVGVRLEMWRDSINIWASHPVLGTGLGDFEKDSYQLYQNGQSRMRVQFGHAHSIYFDVLATAGLVGFFGMLVFIQILPFRMFYSFWIKESDPWLKFYALSGMTTIIAEPIIGDFFRDESWQENPNGSRQPMRNKLQSIRTVRLE